MTPTEKAARALCQLDGHPENIKFEGRPMWQSYLPQVEAVIAAIREPSAWMIDEGCGADFRDRSEPFGLHMRQIWMKMIDAASVDDVGNPETRAMIKMVTKGRRG